MVPPPPRRSLSRQITLALNRPDMAYSAADALASAMYDSMFDWLVGRVNFAVQVRAARLVPVGLAAGVGACAASVGGVIRS